MIILAFHYVLPLSFGQSHLSQLYPSSIDQLQELPKLGIKLSLIIKWHLFFSLCNCPCSKKQGPMLIAFSIRLLWSQQPNKKRPWLGLQLKMGPKQCCFNMKFWCSSQDINTACSYLYMTYNSNVDHQVNFSPQWWCNLKFSTYK